MDEKGNDYSDASDGDDDEGEGDALGDCLSVGGCKEGGWAANSCTERLSFICKKKASP